MRLAAGAGASHVRTPYVSVPNNHHHPLQIACYLNLAQCALKEDSFGEALSFCNKAIE